MLEQKTVANKMNMKQQHVWVVSSKKNANKRKKVEKNTLNV